MNCKFTFLCLFILLSLIKKYSLENSLLRMPFSRILCLDSSIFQDPTQVLSPIWGFPQLCKSYKLNFLCSPLHWLHCTYVIYVIVLSTCVHFSLQGQIIFASPDSQKHSIKVNKVPSLAVQIYFYVYLNEKVHIWMARREENDWISALHLYSVNFTKLYNLIEPGSPSVKWG